MAATAGGEVPITSVTNGVHSPTWINGDLAALYDQYLQPDWRERLEDAKMWELVHEIPNQELWETHRKRKRRMVAFVRERAVQCRHAAQSFGGRGAPACRKCSIRTSSPSALPAASRPTSAPRCCSAMWTG